MQKLFNYLIQFRAISIAKIAVAALGPTLRSFKLDGRNTGLVVQAAAAVLENRPYVLTLPGQTEAEVGAIVNGVAELITGAVNAYDADMSKYGIVLTGDQIASLTGAISARMLTVYPVTTNAS